MRGIHLAKQAGKISIAAIIALVVLGYGGYVGSDTAAAHWQWYKIRRETLDIARFSRGQAIPTIKANVTKAAKDLGVASITPPQISRENHTDAKTTITFSYKREIDLKQFGTKTKNFEIDVFQGMPMVEGHM